MKNYDLGSGKIGRLVRHFSVPCVISMLVAALYNIVDQIFIKMSAQNDTEKGADLRCKQPIN